MNKVCSLCKMNPTYFDIEADNLLTKATTIWCIVAKTQGLYHIYINNVDEWVLPENSIRYRCIVTYMHWLSVQDTLVMHNGISYDLPLLKKLHGYSYSIDPAKLVDTHILSRLYNPDRPEHSLAYFGDILKYPKGDHSDWSQFSQEMLDYCINDVDLTEETYKLLQTEGAGWDWDEAIKLEYNTWHIQQKQEQKGVLFDQKGAEILLGKIQTEIDSLESKLTKEIPYNYQKDGDLKKIFLKNGSYTQPVKDWIEHD